MNTIALIVELFSCFQHQQV